LDSKTEQQSSLKKQLFKYIERLEHANEDTETLSNYSVGCFLPELDSLLNGFKKGSICIISSRPEMGRTSFLINQLCHSSIIEDRNTLFISLSETKDKVLTRIISSLSYVNSYNVDAGLCNDDEWNRIQSAMNLLASEGFHILAEHGYCINSLIKEILDTFERVSPDLVVIDGLHMLAPSSDDKKYEPAFYEELMRKLKVLALEKHIAIIATIPLGLKPEARPNKRGLLGDFQSSSIGDIADRVIFLYRDEVYNDDTVDRGLAEIIVARNCGGPVGTVRAVFLPNYGKFESLEDIVEA
jgi:replicative DNA helicase